MFSMLCSCKKRGEKILICPLICWGGGGCGACFLPHVPDMLASCPILGRAAHTTEMAWSHASATGAALIPALCPPLEQNHGTSQNQAPAFAGRPAILNLSLVELPPRPLSASGDHSLLDDGPMHSSSFSSVCVLTCIGIFACMPCSLAPNPSGPWNAALL